MPPREYDMSDMDQAISVKTEDGFQFFAPVAKGRQLGMTMTQLAYTTDPRSVLEAIDAFESFMAGGRIVCRGVIND